MPIPPISTAPYLAPVTVENPLALTGLWAALENRDAAPAKILVPGDSWVCGAAVAPAHVGGTWAQGFPGVCQRALLAMLPVTGNPPCGIYVPSWQTAGNGPNTWATTGAPTQQSFFGPGMANLRFSAAGTASLTYEGTSADLWFAQSPTVSGTFSWQVDGGPITNVTIPATGTTAKDGYIVPISLGGAGQHVIVLSWVSGTYWFGGAYIYDGDEAKGIRMYPCGHSGWGATDWVAGDVVGQQGISQIVATVQPHLVALVLGLNDWNGEAQTAAQFELNMATIIDKVQAQAPAASILVMSECSMVQNGAPVDTWPHFLEAMHDLAVGLGCAFLDLSPLMPAAASPLASGLYYSDNFHPTIRGHLDIGTYLARGLVSGIGPVAADTLPGFTSGVLAANVTVATVGSTTIYTTKVLQPGRYLLIANLTCIPSSANAADIEVQWQLGTALGSVVGPYSAASGLQANTTLARDQQGVQCVAEVIVTTAGTIQLVGNASGVAVDVLASTASNGFAHASGVTIVELGAIFE